MFRDSSRAGGHVAPDDGRSVAAAYHDRAVAGTRPARAGLSRTTSSKPRVRRGTETSRRPWTPNIKDVLAQGLAARHEREVHVTPSIPRHGRARQRHAPPAALDRSDETTSLSAAPAECLYRCAFAAASTEALDPNPRRAVCSSRPSWPDSVPAVRRGKAVTYIITVELNHRLAQHDVGDDPDEAPSVAARDAPGLKFSSKRGNRVHAVLARDERRAVGDRVIITGLRRLAQLPQPLWVVRIAPAEVVQSASRLGFRRPTGICAPPYRSNRRPAVGSISL